MPKKYLICISFMRMVLCHSVNVAPQTFTNVDKLVVIVYELKSKHTSLVYISLVSDQVIYFFLRALTSKNLC